MASPNSIMSNDSVVASSGLGPLGSEEHINHIVPAPTTEVAETDDTTTTDPLTPAYERMSAPQLRAAYTTHLTTVHTIGQRFADTCTAAQVNAHLAEDVRQEWLSVYDRWSDLALEPHIENEEGIRHRALELRVVLPRLSSVWDDDWPSDGEGRALSPDVEIFGHQPEVQPAQEGQMPANGDDADVDADADNMTIEGDEGNGNAVVVGEHGSVHSGESDSEDGLQQQTISSMQT